MRSQLTQWRPFAEMEDLRSEIEHLFAGNDKGRTWRMAVDVVEENDKLVLHAELPGIKPEEVKIAVEGGILTISGEHEETEEEKGKHFVRRERRHGSFHRSMPLPEGIRPEEIRAEVHDGVVSVTVPMPDHEPTKRVEITPTAA